MSERKTIQEAMTELDAAVADLKRELGRSLGFDWAARHRVNPWFWALFLVLSFDVFVKLTAMGLDALCGGQCL